jgi:hypothetical protein
MVYRLLGYNAISLQSETTNLDESIVNELLSRFKTIIVNYDNDEEGIKNTLKIANVYPAGLQLTVSVGNVLVWGTIPTDQTPPDPNWQNIPT